jgi:histidine ammonia-lyase
MIIENQWYDLASFYRDFKSSEALVISDESRKKVSDCHEYLMEKLNASDKAFYGINTGFGSLCDIRIEPDELVELQHNLIRSHACGVGDTISKDLVKLILLLKIINMSKGYSGVSVNTLNKLVSFYNQDVMPVIYELGSLGASGDLAPLAHLALPLIGEGEVWKEDQKVPTSEMDQSPITLGPKEGLALINGTQFSTAITLWSVMESQRLMSWAIEIAALSTDVFGCRREPFDAKIHDIRQQVGQKKVAIKVKEILSGSGLESVSENNVQDPYAFRCSPQVLGATMDTIDYVSTIVEREINAVTDNPNIFYESDDILTGGNFHAQPIALVADYLAIAMSEVASISERRLYQMVCGLRGLPAYLSNDAGRQSGFMIVQYTAASVVSQNKQLASPASVDSIISSKGQEDHVSMAANAATKLKRVVQNVERVLAMELMTAMQALDFRRPTPSSKRLEALYRSYREKISFVDKDRALYKDIEASVEFIRTHPVPK